MGLDANMLYPSTLTQDFPCGKEKLIKVATQGSEHNLEMLTQGVQNGLLFGFAQVDIEVPPELYERFSEMSLLFVVKEIPDDHISERTHEYRKTGRKRMPGTRKLCGMMKARGILLYTPVLKWYLDHGLKLTAFYSSSSTSELSRLRGFQKKWLMRGDRLIGILISVLQEILQSSKLKAAFTER